MICVVCPGTVKTSQDWLTDMKSIAVLCKQEAPTSCHFSVFGRPFACPRSCSHALVGVSQPAAARAGVNIPPERQFVKRDAIDHTRSPAITIPLQGPSDPPKAGARGGLTFPVHSTHVMQPFDVGTRSKGRWSETLFSFVPPLS